VEEQDGIVMVIHRDPQAGQEELALETVLFHLGDMLDKMEEEPSIAKTVELVTDLIAQVNIVLEFRSPKGDNIQVGTLNFNFQAFKPRKGSGVSEWSWCSRLKTKRRMGFEYWFKARPKEAMAGDGNSLFQPPRKSRTFINGRQG